VADVLIADGYIKAVENTVSDAPDDTEILDCHGLVLGPGLVDLYSHSGEPGFEERETLLSLCRAAAAGGFTRLAILPDTSPAIDNPAVVVQLQRLREEKDAGRRGRGEEGTISLLASPSLRLPLSLPQLYLWGALTQGLEGEQMTELAELAASGVIGFADGKPLNNLGLVRRVLEYLQPLGKPVAFWCCDRKLTANGVVREGVDAIRFGLPGNPAISETSAIAALLEIVAAIGTPVHIMRVSTERTVELIASAKAQGLPVTASTTWMHLLLDTKAVGSYDPSLRLEPPLGNKSDVAALRKAVFTGVVDAIAIDHSPYTYEEKTVSFAEAPPGAIGLELALPLLWQNLVETGVCSALELWRALSTHPAECLQQKPAAILSGRKAEVTLFDPNKLWKVEKPSLHTLSTNTPWLGQQLTGCVIKTWVS
jgi:dihydroorotase